MAPENVIERVKKLLALSKSSNVAEAELALGRANELIQRYQIEILEDFDAATNKWSFTISDGRDALYHGKALRAWEDYLMHKAVEYMGGRIIIRGMGSKDNTRYCYAGTEDDAAFAKLIFWDINERVRAIFKAQKRSLGLTSLDSFGYGVVVSMMDRMMAEKAKIIQAGITERGLVTLDKKKSEFDEYYTELAKGLTTVNSNHKSTVDWHNYTIGKKMGKDLSLPVCNPTL